MKKVFISHINEEANIAATLKTWIENTFAGQVEVFVSSDPDDIPAGKRWLNEIEKAINKLDIMIVLCSKESVLRPWINFETGASWNRGAPIIPICYLGMSKGKLPMPISELQALDLDGTDSLKKLIAALAKHFGIKKIPRISYSEFYEELSIELGKVKYDLSAPKTEQSKNIGVKKSQQEVPIIRLSESEETLLKWIGEDGNHGYTPSYIANRIDMKLLRIDFHMKKLEEKGFLMVNRFYWLTEKGKEYLIENDLI